MWHYNFLLMIDNRVLAPVNAQSVAILTVTCSCRHFSIWFSFGHEFDSASHGCLVGYVVMGGEGSGLQGPDHQLGWLVPWYHGIPWLRIGDWLARPIQCILSLEQDDLVSSLPVLWQKRIGIWMILSSVFTTPTLQLRGRWMGFPQRRDVWKFVPNAKLQEMLT